MFVRWFMIFFFHKKGRLQEDKKQTENSTCMDLGELKELLILFYKSVCRLLQSIIICAKLLDTIPDPPDPLFWTFFLLRKKSPKKMHKVLRKRNFLFYVWRGSTWVYNRDWEVRYRNPKNRLNFLSLLDCFHSHLCFCLYFYLNPVFFSEWLNFFLFWMRFHVCSIKSSKKSLFVFYYNLTKILTNKI